VLSGTTHYVNFNFDTGLFGNSTGCTYSATQISNGFWLIKLTYTAATTIATEGHGIAGINNADTVGVRPSYDLASTNNIVDISAVQIEAGTTATTYIPTTTVAVTRNAETQYVDLWNNSLLNQTNWTLYWEGYLYDGQTTGMSLCLSDTTTAASDTNRIGWYNLNTPFYNIGNTRTNGTSHATNNSLNKFAIQYNNGTVDFYRNGVNIWAGRTVAVFDYRYLVLNSGGSTFTTDKIALFNRTLTNSECALITT